MYKFILFLFFALLSQTDVKAQIVNIPDSIFKASLLAHGSTITGTGITTIDINNDGEIQVSEAQTYSGTINVYYKSIADLTGIQSFTTLTKLNCGYNQLSTLDLTNNTALTHLSCHINQLSNLDLSNNTALIYLFCSSNQLDSLNLWFFDKSCEKCSLAL